MKADVNQVNKRKGRPAFSLNAKLAASFIVYALALMAMLWIFQSLLLDKYYEISMSRRCEKAVNRVSDYYLSGGDELSYEEFLEFLGSESEANDIFFWVESTDGEYYISSSDARQKQGRMFVDGQLLIGQARQSLKEGAAKVSFTQNERIGEIKNYIFAKSVSGASKNPVYVYAVATLTPLGPAVGILRSQLLAVTVIALGVGALVAFIVAMQLARPIANMEIEARELAKGNYDVEFEGGNYKELADLAETLNQAARDLKASDSLQKDLIANVSHDLRTPLTMIKSYAEMIKDISGDNPEKREEHLDVIINETNRLDGLVGDILTLSKMQAGVMEMEMEDFDIQEAAESVFNTYKVMEQEGFTMRFERLDIAAVVHADRHRIQQVIANLLSNAIRYSKDKKEVSLSFAMKDGSVVCSVTDKGLGIDEADLDRIWNRYQKASKQGARSSQGTGLGLSIASEILDQHGAKYGVERSPGEGSRFWFSMDVVKK